MQKARLIQPINMGKKFLLFILTFISLNGFSQLPDSCKLEIGTNLGGLADWGTEIPFVDLMRTSRTWYTKSVGDPNDPFDSGFTNKLTYRSDGYPTHIPQNVDGSQYPQNVATIWAITDGWPSGSYTVLWEGEGELVFWGSYENLQTDGNNRMAFDFPNPKDGTIELKIVYSNINNPIHDIRVLMPGTESTYEQNPFYKLWIDKVSIFNTVRFMDWGQTNGWGLNDEDGFGDDNLVDWDRRSQVDYYTWTHSKGVPYEMMVKYMNQFDKDGWVCVPHSASEDYIRKMARYFRDNLEEDRHIYVEYSNEIWNWIFPQTQWANHYGCELTGELWPEGTTKYIQRMLDYWTDEFKNDLHRTTRVVGVFTGWLDVAQRVAFNIDESSFDAIAPTYYFHLAEDLESNLDNLGSSATKDDVAKYARQSMPEAFESIRNVKQFIADSLNKPMAFYEGGQHLTPNPFGVSPTYEKALLDIQRDTSMYNLYNEWFDQLRTLQDGEEPLLLMNFSFVAHLSAKYGSWGVLESMDQDTSIIPAPKYKSLIENMNNNCFHCSTKKTIEVSSCESYFWNNNTITQSGTYFDTLTNYIGCDSIVKLVLTINNSTHSIKDVSSCDSLEWNGKLYKDSGIYIDTLTNKFGCDSIVTLNLIIDNGFSTEQKISSCDSYTWNKSTYNESGVYIDTLIANNGCDSIVMLNLTITNLDNSITVNDTILTSNENDVTYQWIDCNTNTPILNATNKSYYVIKNGSYAVVISENDCVDTSECIVFNTIGTKENELLKEIHIYPNPTSGKINIDLGNLENMKIMVFSFDGKLVYSKENINTNLYQFSLDVNAGMYFMQLSNQDNISRYKLIMK